MKVLSIPVTISRQEDGLWRAEVLDLQGCFVDGERLEQVLGDIQEAAAMYIDLYREQGRPLPASLASESGRLEVRLPLILEEYETKSRRRANKLKTPA